VKEWTEEDPELARRANRILTKLKMLDEAAGSAIAQAHISSGKAESSAPPEARPDSPSNQPPPKDRSLADWYAFHFDRCTTVLRAQLLCCLAERDYYRYRGKDPRQKIAAKRQSVVPDVAQDEKETIKRIIDWYEGFSSLEVAVYEGCHQGFVEKARRLHRRSEVDGRPRRGWDGWDDKTRQAKVLNLAAQGMKKRAIAERLDVSDRTIGRYLKAA